MKDLELKNKIFEKERSFSEQIELNKKILKIQLLKESNYQLKKVLDHLGRAIEINKELAHRTEMWETKETFNYQINNWNDIKKVRGYITRYYNTICRILRQEEWIYFQETRKIEKKGEKK